MHPPAVTAIDVPAIDVIGATVDFAQNRALDGVFLCLPAGQCGGIVGESGSGKTTLLRAILGLQPLSAGQISLLGVPVTPGTRNYRAQARQIQPIFQDPAQSLSPRRRIGQSMDEVAACLAEPREALRARLDPILLRLGLPARVVDQYPHQLSGGQARRAAIARALLFGPRILVADEPTAGLDVSVQGDLLNLLQEIRAETGTTLLVISHNIAVVRLIADQVTVIHRGKVVEAGPAAAVFDAPSAAYTRQLIASWPGAAQS